MEEEVEKKRKWKKVKNVRGQGGDLEEVEKMGKSGSRSKIWVESRVLQGSIASAQQVQWRSSAVEKQCSGEVVSVHKLQRVVVGCSGSVNILLHYIVKMVFSGCSEVAEAIGSLCNIGHVTNMVPMSLKIMFRMSRGLCNTDTRVT